MNSFYPVDDDDGAVHCGPKLVHIGFNQAGELAIRFFFFREQEPRFCRIRFWVERVYDYRYDRVYAGKL